MGINTLSNFSKLTGLSTKILKPELVKLFSGREKNIQKAYLLADVGLKALDICKNLGIKFGQLESFTNEKALQQAYEKAEETHVSKRPNTDEELEAAFAAWDTGEPIQETHVLPPPVLDREALNKYLHWVSKGASTPEGAAEALGLTLPKFNDHLAEFEARARIKAAEASRGV